MLKEAVKTEKSCGFKTNELCMFAGTEHEDKQSLDFVQEELNLKVVQIDNELARSQKQMERKESNQDVDAEREGPADDWSNTSGGFTEEDAQPCATVTAQEEVRMNAGDDDMLQQCYREIALLKYLLINSEYDRKIAADERVQYSE